MKGTAPAHVKAAIKLVNLPIQALSLLLIEKRLRRAEEIRS